MPVKKRYEENKALAKTNRFQSNEINYTRPSPSQAKTHKQYKSNDLNSRIQKKKVAKPPVVTQPVISQVCKTEVTPTVKRLVSKSLKKSKKIKDAE